MAEVQFADSRARICRLSSSELKVLQPFDRREGLTTAQAAMIAGRTERRIRQWCIQHHLGRRVAGGPWLVSRVALAAFLCGDFPALRAYLAGDRSSPPVLCYFEAAGLGDLPEHWRRRARITAAEIMT